MEARKYRVGLNLSKLDFPSIKGIGEQKDFTETEPPIFVNNKIELKITKKIILIETYTNKEHEILTVQSVYEIPPDEIRSREDIYEFYKDASLVLIQVYQHAQKQLPLPNLSFLTPPAETYQKEIDGVFNLLNSRN